MLLRLITFVNKIQNTKPANQIVLTRAISSAQRSAADGPRLVPNSEVKWVCMSIKIHVDCWAHRFSRPRQWNTCLSDPISIWCRLQSQGYGEEMGKREWRSPNRNLYTVSPETKSAQHALRPMKFTYVEYLLLYRTRTENVPTSGETNCYLKPKTMLR